MTVVSYNLPASVAEHGPTEQRLPKWSTDGPAWGHSARPKQQKSICSYGPSACTDLLAAVIQNLQVSNLRKFLRWCFLHLPTTPSEFFQKNEGNPLWNFKVCLIPVLLRRCGGTRVKWVHVSCSSGAPFGVEILHCSHQFCPVVPINKKLPCHFFVILSVLECYKLLTKWLNENAPVFAAGIFFSARNPVWNDLYVL